MEKAVILTISFFLLTFYCFVSLVSSVDTLVHGDSLNSSASLVSANKVFTLGFYKPKDTNNTYLGIWYTDSVYPNYPVWLGNREKPIMDNSGILTISSAGELIIITSNRSDPIELYAGGNGTNITATLLNTGNFVVREMNINGSEGRILWESFDYPTDTLIAGMKLGVNHRTGRNWSLTSWFNETNPASGAFTLQWDPGTRRLIVLRRGLAYWTSGDLKNYTDENSRLNVKEFENIVMKPDVFNLNYNFTNVSNGVEDYFSYSLIIDPELTPERRKIISGWRLAYNGDISDHERPMIIALVSHCYGDNIQGCELREQPSCRNHDEIFVSKSGYFADGHGVRVNAESNENASLTESDCRENCWKDCECAGFRYDYRCSYWKGKTNFVQSLDGSEQTQFVLVPHSTKRWKTWKIITLVIAAVIVLLLGCVWFIIRKIEQGRRKKEELRELMTLEGYTETHPVESDGGQGHHLRLFTYSSILKATGSFLSTNKLGEGGFGPVYKGKTVEGQEIAVKVLSRSFNSNQKSIFILLALTIAHNQMEKDVILTISFFLLTFYCFVSLVSSVDTLIHGDCLNSSASLVSANKVFTLGFYKPKDTNNSYLGIWYTDSVYPNYPVWLGNREKPIMDNSGILTICSAGKLIITSNRSDPIEQYAGRNGTNITAMLLNSGNFVVRKMNINGSAGRILWESFDYPIHTLIPGMKLDVNHRTGRNWYLTSSFGENNPLQELLR
ncbi:unnamed protein product [Fraxinus pennsylvanica]|uniref:non-specific serine/threonine protein kinase n=1 Tax=Fraxinus pennsylvanica TaxID=56036 RepID=A0AAD1ZM00_9LAMI|nr:unnamed protein product [Fraxinus pennsylvanica]